MLRLIRQNRLSKWFSGYGQEAIAVGCAWALGERDVILPMHRNLGVWTTRGLPLDRLFCQLMGKEGGFTQRPRPHLPLRHAGAPDRRDDLAPRGDAARRRPGSASRRNSRARAFVACAFVGEGATREGDFHEALNLAAVWKLPVLFVVENNRYGLSTPTNEAMAVEDIADAAAGYAMAGEVVDGNDVLAVIDAVTRAADRGRAGEGPTLLEMKTFRMRGHEEASGTKYVPDALFDTWSDRDPLLQYRQPCQSPKAGSRRRRSPQIDAALAAEIEEVAEWAIRQPDVESDLETERAALFAPSSVVTTTPEGGATEKRFIDAVQDGLRQAMEADDRVVLMGQDVAEYGGVFKVTQGFVEQFGKDRIRNTPIIESGALGCAMGLALEGFRPVVEMQYADFITCGFNQIVNNLGTTHYRWNEPLNVTIRAPFGGGIGAGPFHSPEPRGMVRARARPQSRRPRHARRREGPADGVDRGPQPGPVFRAQAPLPFAQRRRAGRAVHRRARRGERRARGRGPDARDVGRRRAVGHRRGGALGRARGGDRTRRPADARAVGPGDGAAFAREDEPAARAPRGAADGRLRRRSRRPAHRGGLRAPRCAASSVLRRRTCRSRSRKRSKHTSTRRAASFARPSSACSLTEAPLRASPADPGVLRPATRG